MKAIILRDLANQTQGVFVRNELSDEEEKKIRLQCKESGFLVVIKETMPVRSVEDMLEEIRILGEDA